MFYLFVLPKNLLDLVKRSCDLPRIYGIMRIINKIIDTKLSEREEMMRID
jgi:hypothetical protein